MRERLWLGAAFALGCSVTSCSTTSKSDNDAVGLLGFEGACATCVNDSCAPEVEACNGDTACVKVAACRNEAPNPATIQTCLADQPSETVERYGALTGCFAQACRTSCTLGSDLSCLGNYDFPRASSEVGGTLTLLNGETEAPLSGVELSACELLDPACDNPTTQTVTDENGRADLIIDASNLPFGWRGIIRARGGGTYPGIVVQSRPFIRRVDLGVVPFVAEDFLEPVAFLLEEGTGLVLVLALDCWSLPMGGLQVRLVDLQGEEVSMLYVDESLGVAGDRTTQVGLAMNFAVAPGSYTAEVIEPDTGRVIGRTPLDVRAGEASAAIIEPKAAE